MLCAPVGTRATSVILAKLTCGYDCCSSSTTVVTAITTSSATPAAIQASGRRYHGRAAGGAGGPGGGPGGSANGGGETGGAEMGGPETGGAAPFGVSAADGAGGTTSASAPSATGNSGCSSTVGAIPRWECRSRATIGSRDEPPTRNSPANWSGRRPQRPITAAVSYTARCISGPAIRSSSSRVRCTAFSIPGTATGATATRGGGQPARWAAFASTVRRAGPHVAGYVTAAVGRNPTASTAARATAPSTAPSRSTVDTSWLPSSTVASSTRRFGFGSNRAGSSAAIRSASRPTCSSPLGSRYAAEGSTGTPSNSNGRVRPSGHRTTATVLEVPRSTL